MADERGAEHEPEDPDDVAADERIEWDERYRALGDRFRGWYGELEDERVNRQVPGLLVSPTPGGGAYTLIASGRSATVHPVRHDYTVYRVVAHLPVAIWSLHRLAPSLSSYQLGSRLRDLSASLDEVRPDVVAGGVDHSSNGARFESATDVLEACSAFLHDPGVLEDRGAVLALLDVVREPAALVTAAAARMQALDCTDTLSVMRQDLGSEWATLVAIVGTQPTQRGDGPHLAIVRRAMGEAAESEGRLFVAHGTQDEELLRHRLGTVLTNRDLASDWYGDARRLDVDHLTEPVIDALDSLDHPD